MASYSSLGVPLAGRAQTLDQLWQITINLGPCEAFARGTFRPMYSGPVGTYLVGGVDGESQCTGEFANSTFDVGSGMAFAVLPFARVRRSQRSGDDMWLHLRYHRESSGAT